MKVNSVNKNGIYETLRSIRFLFLGLSLIVFLGTALVVVLGYREVMTWEKGGEAGFQVLGAIYIMSILGMIGIVASLALCALTIPFFKGAIGLFIVEMVALAFLLYVAVVIQTVS
jgi:hypothetical protein